MSLILDHFFTGRVRCSKAEISRPNLHSRVGVVIIYAVIVYHAGLYHGRQLFTMHTFDMSSNVHLLFGTIVTIRALKLGVFAAFPFLMVPQRTFQLIMAAAIRAFDSFRVFHIRWRACRREGSLISISTASSSTTSFASDTLYRRDTRIGCRPGFPST